MKSDLVISKRKTLGVPNKKDALKIAKFKLKQQKKLRWKKRKKIYFQLKKTGWRLKRTATLRYNTYDISRQNAHFRLVKLFRLQFKRYRPGAVLQYLKSKPILKIAQPKRVAANRNYGRYAARVSRALDKRLVFKKVRINTYDKLFYYYSARTSLSLYSHKAFLIIEMQINASLVRIKLVPYLFIVNALCFYRVVEVNGVIVSSPYHVLSRYDSVNIPLELHHYAYYRSYRTQYYPWQLAAFFKYYWIQFINFNQNKIGLLSNFLVSNITAEGIVFDYPNIISYMSPFSRFTNLYFRNQVYTDTEDVVEEGKAAWGGLAYTHTIIKLKLFTYANFYKPK